MDRILKSDRLDLNPNSTNDVIASTTFTHRKATFDNFLATLQGCRKRGGGAGGAWPPHKIWTRSEKGPHFLVSFGLSAINQYFLVTLFSHIVNLPAHSNFSMRSQTVITTNRSEKKNFGNFQ